MWAWLKEFLAIRRIFSLVDMITNTKFSNCPNVIKIGVVWQEICTAGNKIRFKVIHHLQYRENVHFLLPPLILRLNTGCRLGETLSKCIASFKISKSAKMLRMGVLFISKTLPYSFCSCVRNTPKIVSFVIRKMKLVSFSLF